MGLGEKLCAAVTSHVPICRPDIYQPEIGEEPELYCTYNYDEIPRVFADGRPNAIVYLIMVHLYAPLGKDTQILRSRLKNALHNAGCTYPEVENSSDANGQHYVFECQYMDGDM